MKRILTLALALATCRIAAADTPNTAAPAPVVQPPAGGASEASVRELLAITDVKKMLPLIMNQMHTISNAAIQQQMSKMGASDSSKKLAIDMQARIQAIIAEELSWEKLEPTFMKVYEETFTQDEIDGIIAFYKTPSGQAVIRKMPQVSQRTMVLIQAQMGPLMEKIQKVLSDTAASAKAAADK
jgi:uncharacterized protein